MWVYTYQLIKPKVKLDEEISIPDGPNIGQKLSLQFPLMKKAQITYQLRES